MAGHRLGLVGVMVIMVGIIPPTTNTAISPNSVIYTKQWGEWEPWVICSGEYCGLGKRSRIRKELTTGKSRITPGPVGTTSNSIPFDPPKGQRCRGLTILLGDAAVLQRILVMKERETVMDVVMEVLMMEMKVARVTLCVAVITACSLVCTTIRRMTAVRKLREESGWGGGS
eukprot:TRINITY_DN10837_c0_g1_i1.p1 TRINITY_DN10837_c0_g1~~TRINITY_DN10837_c0_g1_i1.p1  ORF type:complete len:172 (-),score=28.75 TRINITY_DN10837_c0_g1_i1:175-690(-)